MTCVMKVAAENQKLNINVVVSHDSLDSLDSHSSTVTAANPMLLCVHDGVSVCHELSWLFVTVHECSSTQRQKV